MVDDIIQLSHEFLMSKFGIYMDKLVVFLFLSVILLQYFRILSVRAECIVYLSPH
jgi:hypothetical protein